MHLIIENSAIFTALASTELWLVDNSTETNFIASYKCSKIFTDCERSIRSIFRRKDWCRTKNGMFYLRKPEFRLRPMYESDSFHRDSDAISFWVCMFVALILCKIFMMHQLCMVQREDFEDVRWNWKTLCSMRNILYMLILRIIYILIFRFYERINFTFMSK